MIIAKNVEPEALIPLIKPTLIMVAVISFTFFNNWLLERRYKKKEEQEQKKDE